MVYADYEFYKNEYRGAMPEADFYRNLAKASAYLDFITHGRAARYNDPGSKLKYAVCAVADEYQLNDQGGGVVSASNGKLSETYANASSAKALDARLYDAAKVYLSGTGLLSRGIVYDCRG